MDVNEDADTRCRMMVCPVIVDTMESPLFRMELQVPQMATPPTT